MDVALLSLLLALFKQQKLRERQRYTLRPIDDPLALEAELSIKQQLKQLLHKEKR